MYTKVQVVDTYEEWRTAARTFLQSSTPPEAISWQSPHDAQDILFHADYPAPAPSAAVSVPREFFSLAETVSRHSDPSRWAILYRVAWRLTHGERNLLHIETDDDVRALQSMQKAIGHELHKMRAFVRFRRVLTDDGREQFIAWYEPYHRTLDANAKFFVDRFRGMEWAILTPYQSMYWDTRELRFGPGVARSEAPPEDELDNIWRSYYGAIYNPARLSLDAMRAQLPVQRWKDLPEARIIPELVRTSRGNVQSMADRQPVSAEVFIPKASTLEELRQAIPQCRACGLCAAANGPVFGEGPASARIALVGEQPGDEEDLQRRPFVGPAGKVLDQVLSEAGLARSDLYVTNAVKAFKFIERGKRRIHQTPKAAEIATCKPWLSAELQLVQPKAIVTLGGSASQAVFGRAVRVNAERGQPQGSPLADAAVVTFHPSAILRAPDEQTQQHQRKALVADLKLAAEIASRS
ncbi:MAG TPA: UdgX family uracil-DNA binding protein [Bryobacteraceae bacterium]|nr:UdgX family uracil-DNA binding protein [Bryobacteraceae bacterium]